MKIGTVPREPVSWGHTGIPALCLEEDPEEERTHWELVSICFLFFIEIIDSELRREEDEDRETRGRCSKNPPSTSWGVSLRCSRKPENFHE